MSLLIVFGLMTGGYHLFLSGAEFFHSQGELGSVLVDRIFYLGWSIIFYLLVLSNIITAFSTLYRSPEISFLMTLPVDHLKIFRLKLIENMFYSSWAILILGTPLTLAYGKIMGVHTLGYLGIISFGLLPLLILAAISGAVLLMIVVQLSRYFRMPSIFIVLGLIFAGVFTLYFRFNQQDTILGGELANFRALGRYMANMSRTPFALIPSYWLSQLFLNGADKKWWDLFYYGLLFISSAAVGWEVVGWQARKYYFKTYQIMEGQQARNRKGASRLFGFSWKGLSPPMKALINKDLLQFLRTPQQWVQFLLLGFFIAVYLINLSRGRLHFGDLPTFWKNIIYIFNFGFSGFIISALVARFVFPMISMEGHGRWLIQSAPLPLKKIFIEKFWLSFVALFTLTEVVALVSNHFLNLGFRISVLSTGFLMMTSLALISLALGLGAVYAQFNETNPMKISSGYGGIITVVFSMLYIAVSLAGLINVIRLLETKGNGAWIIVVIASIIGMTALYTWLPINWGVKALEKHE